MGSCPGLKPPQIAKDFISVLMYRHWRIQNLGKGAAEVAKNLYRRDEYQASWLIGFEGAWEKNHKHATGLLERNVMPHILTERRPMPPFLMPLRRPNQLSGHGTTYPVSLNLLLRRISIDYGHPLNSSTFSFANTLYRAVSYIIGCLKPSLPMVVQRVK
ncbi:hypothetical protein AVEN_208543-1 [Araneus ventricosus]|uniref:Uncharacterized protein n=1 Tax=Araneus ventricosus TaxID=182803 RepID=A0A4Y2SC85_ARAVE|nr:hypothetical protein AVEN_227420-1 [Araneus ventricosus]GBN84906.1 hypothetical protein AVEN_208543-1 [Araneus ventricosus]